MAGFVRRLLVPVTNSPYRKSVMLYGSELARLLDGQVELALFPGAEADWDSDESLTTSSELEEPEAGGLLRSAAQAACEEFHRVAGEVQREVTSVVLRGEPVEEYLTELQSCDVGFTGRALLGRLDPGDGLHPTVVTLIERATKPIIIVPEEHRSIGRVLVAYGGGSQSGHALELVAAMASEQMQITLLTVMTGDPEQQRVAVAGERYLKSHGVSCEAKVVRGQPSEKILDVAREMSADLVVLGDRRTGWLERLVTPDVAREVIESLRLPMLVWN